MINLPRFLGEQLSDYGRQLEFAREVHISPGTVSKWMSGENTPNFESCLRIAAYFHVNPVRVFKMAGRIDYYRLYSKIFESLEWHDELYGRLQALLASGHAAEIDKVFSKIEKRRRKA